MWEGGGERGKLARTLMTNTMLRVTCGKAHHNSLLKQSAKANFAQASHPGTCLYFHGATTGSDLATAVSLGPSSHCDMPCPGNSSETCGGGLAMDVWEVVDQYWQVAGANASGSAAVFVHISACWLPVADTQLHSPKGSSPLPMLVLCVRASSCTSILLLLLPQATTVPGMRHHQVAMSTCSRPLHRPLGCQPRRSAVLLVLQCFTQSWLQLF